MSARLCLSVYFLFSAVSYILAQPHWLDPTYRANNYPRDEYLIGFSSMYFRSGDIPNELVKECRQYARIDLAESLAVSVHVAAKVSISQRDKEYEGAFDLNSISTSSLDAVGMVTDDYVDSDRGIVYAFAYLSRRDLVKAYYKNLSVTMSKVNSILREESHENNQQAYDRYTQGLYLMTQAQSFTNMLMNLDITNEAVLRVRAQSAMQLELRERINKVKLSEDIDLELAIQLLVDQLMVDSRADEEYFVSPLTYMDQGITSEFSSYFDQVFKEKLITKGKVSTRVVEHRITGNYWMSEDQVRVSINIHKYDGDDPYQLVSGESLIIRREVLDSLQVAYEFTEEDDIDVLEMAENNANGGLYVKLNSNKGNEGLFFKEGDTLKLYLQVSRPAYVRLVNVWSEGQQMLMLQDGYYIGEDRVNSIIELPFEMITQCPCGIELIKMYAQSQPFPPLETETIDGMDFISGSLYYTNAKTRSMLTEKEFDDEFYFGEASLLATTLPVKN